MNPNSTLKVKTNQFITSEKMMTYSLEKGIFFPGYFTQSLNKHLLCAY